MRKPVRAILKTMLDDIRSDDDLVRREIAATLRSDNVADILIKAGCPVPIIQAMRETVHLSSFERKYCCQEIRKAIKKIPAE